jgi:hypothetical protein
VRSIVAEIVGEKEAAERVELVLPETGVCSRRANVPTRRVLCQAAGQNMGIEAGVGSAAI